MAIDPKTLRSGDVVLVRAVYSHSADRWKHAVSVEIGRASCRERV